MGTCLLHIWLAFRLRWLLCACSAKIKFGFHGREQKFDGGDIVNSIKHSDTCMNLSACDFDPLWCLDNCLSVSLEVQDNWTPTGCLNYGLLTQKPSPDLVSDPLASLKPSGHRSSPLNFRPNLNWFGIWKSGKRRCIIKGRISPLRISKDSESEAQAAISQAGWLKSCLHI